MIEQKNKKKQMLIAIVVLVLIPMLFLLGFLTGQVFLKPKSNVYSSQIEKNLREIIEVDAMYGKNTYADEEIFRGKLFGILNLMNDPYSDIIYNDGSTVGALRPSNIDDISNPRYNLENMKIGIVFQFTTFNEISVNAVNYDSDALGKIFPGDLIKGIKQNNEDILFKGQSQEYITNLLKYTSNKQSVQFIIERNGKEVFPTVSYKDIKEELVTDYQYFSEEKTSYIKLRRFDEGSGKKFKTEIDKANQDKAQKLILDLRGNPGGYLNELNNMVQVLVPATKDKTSNVLFYAETYKSKQISQKIIANSSLEKQDYMDNIKVLVDENTASAAESLASILKSEMNAEIIGKPTYGKDIYQITIPIENSKYSVKYTQGYWKYRSDEKFYTLREKKILDEATKIDELYLQDHVVPLRNRSVKIEYQNSLINEKLFLEYFYDIKINSDQDLILAIDKFATENKIDSHESGFYEVEVSQALYVEYVKRVNDLKYDAYFNYALNK